MKKIALIALVVVLVLSLAACGRRKNNGMDDNTTIPTTNRDILPETKPTAGTNIPDPNVNGNSTNNNMDNNIIDDMLPDGDVTDNATSPTKETTK